MATGLFFLILGLTFLAIRLVNKDKWEEPKPTTPSQKKTMIWLIIIGVVLFLAALAFYLSKT